MKRWHSSIAFTAFFALLFAALDAAALSKWDIEWSDYDNNPIEVNGPGDRVYMPYVLYNEAWPQESRFRMWYDYASIAGIAYSYSADGIAWSDGAIVTGLNLDGSAPQGRPVVLYNPEWAKPYRLYYYGNPGDLWQIRVAESEDGVAFENDRLALVGDGLGTWPDGHAVAHFPGREEPFWMYYRGPAGILYATSVDGYDFFEVDYIELYPDPLYSMHPTQVFEMGQNDYRMLAFAGNTANQYLVSANGHTWELWEDPIANVGGLGPAGSWNDQRNYYASIAYLGEGRFYMARGGRNDASGIYETGIAFGHSEFYARNDVGVWSYFSPFENYAAEGWYTYGSNVPHEDGGDIVGVIQNDDNTVTIVDLMDSGNYYLVRDAEWAVPFTVEVRLRIDEAYGTGGDAAFPKGTVALLMNDPFHPGPETWQPAFAQSRFGAWNLASDPTADADLTEFQTFTIVSRFSEEARDALILNPSDGSANVRQCVYDVYINRDFSEPAVTFNNTGWFGWDEVSELGRVDIGFPGPSAGLMTVDWIRWGNGVIFDENEPGETEVSDWLLY